MMKQTKRPYATNTKRRSVTITESDWQKLKALGNGNASAGIRKAVTECQMDATTGRTSDDQA